MKAGCEKVGRLDFEHGVWRIEHVLFYDDELVNGKMKITKGKHDRG